MTSMRKLKRDHTSADLAAVEGMLSGLADEDFLTRMSLESRRDELKNELAAIPEEDEVLASAAIFFGGRPVVGSLGIESEFAGNAVRQIQDLIAKQYSSDMGTLGQRGVVPHKEANRLHVTEMLRGSVGFLLQELRSQPELVTSSLKGAVDNVNLLLSAFAKPDEKEFEAAVEAVDERVLTAAKEFFSLLGKEGATLRFVANDIELSFDDAGVARAATRATSTIVKDKEEVIPGRLAGILPQLHRFEFVTLGPRAVINGRIDRTVSTVDATKMLSDWLNKDCAAVVSVRQVIVYGEVVREAFTLKAITASSTK